MTLIHPTHTHTLLSAHRESLQLANRLANTHYTPTALPAKSTRHHAMPPPQSPLLILNKHMEPTYSSTKKILRARHSVSSENASDRPHHRQTLNNSNTRANSLFPPPPRPPAAPTQRTDPHANPPNSNRTTATTTTTARVPVSWLKTDGSQSSALSLPATWRRRCHHSSSRSDNSIPPLLPLSCPTTPDSSIQVPRK